MPRMHSEPTGFDTGTSRWGFRLACPFTQTPKRVWPLTRIREQHRAYRSDSNIPDGTTVLRVVSRGCDPLRRSATMKVDLSPHMKQAYTAASFLPVNCVPTLNTSCQLLFLLATFFSLFLSFFLFFPFLSLLALTHYYYILRPRSVPHSVYCSVE